jgi:hypothetical protein
MLCSAVQGPFIASHPLRLFKNKNECRICSAFLLYIFHISQKQLTQPEMGAVRSQRAKIDKLVFATLITRLAGCTPEL